MFQARSNPAQGLFISTGKVNVQVIIYFSAIEIELYSFYRKNLIAVDSKQKQKKEKKKSDRSPHSFTRKRRFISQAKPRR